MGRRITQSVKQRTDLIERHFSSIKGMAGVFAAVTWIRVNLWKAIVSIDIIEYPVSPCFAFSSSVSAWVTL